MKSLFYTLLMLSCSISVSAQQLRNTVWGTLLGGPDTLTVTAKVDTFYVDAAPDSNLVTALYEERADTMLIRDLFGPYACTNPDTGYYQFSIANDTLRMTFIADNCATRSVFLDGAVLWKIVNFTGLRNVSQVRGVEIYPNPSKGDFDVRTRTNMELRIYDSNGRLIRDLFLTSGLHSIRLDTGPGMYLAQFRAGSHLTTRRLCIF